MFKYYKTKKRPVTIAPNSITAFQYLPSTNPIIPTSWGTWLQAQPAPVFKPGHRLQHLSMYYAGVSQEYELSLDSCERWGYALNCNYAGNQASDFTDAALAKPTTINGKLLKKAISDPNRYPVAAAIGQKYPDAADVPEGFLHTSDGTIITGAAGWSPLATPAAMQKAVDFKLAPLRRLAAAGVKIATVYDGGEEGLHIPGNAFFPLDPAVVAAKGSLTWYQFISLKKGEHLRLMYEAVKLVAPNREYYLYYPSSANAFANIPGAEAYGWSYAEMKTGCDLPSGSLYYRDNAASDQAMGNPNKRDRLYYDVLTHQISAVAEQIANNVPYSFSFVSAGTSHNSALGGADLFMMSLNSYRGFLKCVYVLGSLGAVASYFTPNCTLSDPTYDVYSTKEAPHWLYQQMVLGEVHARFSWLDEYILDGDLLQGVGQGAVKNYYPSYEFPATLKVSSIYLQKLSVRAFARKLRNIDKWLLVLWSSEQADGTDSPDIKVFVRDIPGVEPIEYLARSQGSIYVIDRTSGSTVVTMIDSNDNTPKNFGITRPVV